MSARVKVQQLDQGNVAHRKDINGAFLFGWKSAVLHAQAGCWLLSAGLGVVRDGNKS